MKIFIPAAFVILGVLFSLSNSHAESRFRMRLLADPQSFDWNLAYTPMDTPLVMNIMEGLVEFDQNMKIKPALSQSWSVSKDQKTYTFKLRKNVQWSDGKKLKAQDFVYSWKRLLDPKTAASYAYFLFDIVGAQEFNSGKLKNFSKVGIKALDTHTLQVKLKKPVSYFIQMLSFWVTFPLREDVVKKHGDNWSKPGNTVVLGPYIPVSYSPGDHILLKRNEKYYGKRPATDSVLMRVVSEDSTALNLFQSGQLDYTRPINFLERANFVGTKAFHSDPYLRTCFIQFNTTKAPFNKPELRQAIAHAIDKSKLERIFQGTIRTAHSLIPSEILKKGVNTDLKLNPKKAKQLLKQAGLTPQELEGIGFYTYSGDETQLLAQFIQGQLQKNIGLNMKVNALEYKTYRAQMDLKTGDLYFRCWGADYADPDTFFGMFLSNSGNNKTGWKNKRYDTLVRKAASLSNGVQRTKLYVEALNLILQEEAIVIPLYYDSLTYLLSPKIKGFVINPLNYVFFRDIVISKP